LTGLARALRAQGAFRHPPRSDTAVHDFVQDVLVLARRPLFAFRHHARAHCVLDVLLHIPLATVGQRHVRDFDRLRGRYDALRVDLDLLVAILSEVGVAPDSDYQMPHDYGLRRRRAARLRYRRIGAGGLRHGAYLAVEGLWLTWASFLDRLTSMYRYVDQVDTIFTDRGWAQQLRASTARVLPAARSQLDLIVVDDIDLIQDQTVSVDLRVTHSVTDPRYRRQSLLRIQDELAAPTAATINAVSSHLKT
jgi:transcriptional regulator of met regulon